MEDTIDKDDTTSIWDPYFRLPSLTDLHIITPNKLIQSISIDHIVHHHPTHQHSLSLDSSVDLKTDIAVVTPLITDSKVNRAFSNSDLTVCDTNIEGNKCIKEDNETLASRRSSKQKS
ncbi:unnamed protein product [Trichobilharzia regenti]|nr:unnamed protein product [Trichobilharzia regenti]